MKGLTEILEKYETNDLTLDMYVLGSSELGFYMRPIDLDGGVRLRGNLNNAIMTQNLGAVNVTYKHHNNFNTSGGGFGGNMVTNTPNNTYYRNMNQR